MTNARTTVDLEYLKNTCGFTTTVKQWSARRKADLSQVTTDADKDSLSMTKELIKCPELKAIRTHFSELSTWIKSRTVPSCFKRGFYLASKDARDAIEERLKRANEVELPPLISALQVAYPSQIAAAREKLQGQFDATDYPPEEVLPELFGMEWFWIDFVPAKALSPEARAAEEAKLNARLLDAGDQITQALREAFAKLIAHATEKLTVAPGEKPKVFRDSMIGNIQEFLETFASRNITNDTQLAELVEKSKNILQGASADPEKLRKMPTVRDETARQFAEIQTALDGMIETRKTRFISADDE